MKLGVLAAETSWYFRDLVRAAGSTHWVVEPLTFSSLSAAIGEPPTIGAIERDDLSTLDAVLVRTMAPGTLEQVVFRMDALHRLDAGGTLVINPPRAIEIAVDKYLASALIQAAGLPTPPTRVCQTVDAAMDAFAALGGDVVIKPLFGSEGRGLTRVSDESLAWRAFKGLTAIGQVIYLQAFVPHEGSDVRVLLIGEQALAMRRRHPHDWRTNVSRGAVAEAITVRDEWLDLARRAALAVQAPIVGVDLLPARSGELYVLEANAVPGWKAIARCQNVDVASMVLSWLESEVVRRCERR